VDSLIESLVAQRINFIARMATSCDCNQAEDKELALVWIAELSAPYENRLSSYSNTFDNPSEHQCLGNSGSVEE
jgi:hypothetical protein